MMKNTYCFLTLLSTLAFRREIPQCNIKETYPLRCPVIFRGKKFQCYKKCFAKFFWFIAFAAYTRISADRRIFLSLSYSLTDSFADWKAVFTIRKSFWRNVLFIRSDNWSHFQSLRSVPTRKFFSRTVRTVQIV